MLLAVVVLLELFGTTVVPANTDNEVNKAIPKIFFLPIFFIVVPPIIYFIFFASFLIDKDIISINFDKIM